MTVLALSGVDQSTPTSGATTRTTNGGSSALSVSSMTGDLVVDAIYASQGSSTPAVGPGQTAGLSTHFATGNTQLGASYESGSASTTMSWSGLQNVFSFSLSHAAVNINQALPKVELSVSASSGAEAGTSEITVTGTTDSAVSSPLKN